MHQDAGTSRNIQTVNAYPNRVDRLRCIASDSQGQKSLAGHHRSGKRRSSSCALLGNRLILATHHTGTRYAHVAAQMDTYRLPRWRGRDQSSCQPRSSQ